MRRVALFDAYPHAYAGAQRTDHLLAQHLPAHGWELVVVMPHRGVFTDLLADDKLPHRIVAAPPALGRYGRTTTGLAAVRASASIPGYWRRLARQFRRDGVDVVHAVGHRGLIMAGPAARLAGLPLVWHVQGVGTSRPLNLAGSAVASLVAVPTTAVLDRMPDLQRWCDVEEIPNVIPDHARRARPVEPPDEPLVVSSARIHPDKGLDVLLEAFAETRRRVPAARLVVLGAPQDGYEDLLPALRAQAEELGVDDAVEFAGHVDRPDEHVAEAAVYVQSSRERTELLPLAILEAMAAGVPVVATDVGGVGSIVRDGVSGRLVTPGDSAGLASALVELLGDVALRARLGQGAFTIASEDHYTVAGLVAGFRRAYERVAR